MAATNFPGYDQNPIYEEQNTFRAPLLLQMWYKNYKWPHNPATYNIKFSKRVIQHNYMGINNAEIEDMGMEARVMSGSGTFFGPDAYEEFKRLTLVFFDRGPGLLFHPLWQDAQCVFSKLDLSQEPLPDYVSYTFEFIEHVDINVIEEIVSATNEEENIVVTSANSITHTVKQNETLSGIGAKYGVPWRQIATDNKDVISDPNNIQIGMQLLINKPNKNPNSTSSKASTSNSGRGATGDKAYDRFMRDFGEDLGGE